MKIVIFVFMISLFSSCQDAGQGFANLEETIEPDALNFDDIPENPVEIISYSPKESPVRVANGLETTFVVAINPSAGNNVAFTWKLNGSLLSDQKDPFLSLSGDVTDPGINTLEVVATNSVSEASKMFTLYKNSPPSIDSTSPEPTGNTVTCGGANNITLEATASDVDADNLNFTWKLNGVPNHAAFNTLNTGTTSSTIFTPPCALAGINIISLEVDDGYESNITTWSVSIVNPLVAQIIGYTPAITPVVIQENDTQLFTVSASGQAPFTYTWGINDDPSISSNSTPSYTAAASSFPQPDGVTELGDHTFTATVIDDNGSSDTHIFAVKINNVPTISNPIPSASSVKMNVNSTRVFSISAIDLNNDPLTYTWTLNGGAAPSGVFSGSGASITFNPTNLQLGDNVIKVVVQDGFSLYEVSRVWNINVNHFSEECNALAAGEVCTLVGPPGLSSNIDPVLVPQAAKIRPYELINDGNDNYFILDSAQDVIWFYNQSENPITVIGTTVDAGKLKVIAGVGAYGMGTAGVIPTKYQMGEPSGIAWDSERGDLYVSLRYARRIVRFTSSGSSQHVICSGGNNNNAAGHVHGGPAANHACYSPTGIGIYNNAGIKRLYVANNDHDNIKYFDISDNDPANWTGYLLICDKNGAGACVAGNTNGNIGNDSAARVNNPWGLHVDANGLVHWTEQGGGCRIGVANPTATTYSFYNGSINLAPNKAYRVGGSGNCDTYAVGSSNRLWSAQRIKSPYGVLPYYNGTTYYGWFVTNADHDAITFFNTHNAAITIGGRQVDARYSDFIWGNRIDGFNGDAGSAINTLLWYPWGMTYDSTGTKLIVGDRDNYRIRTLDISTSDGEVTTMLAGKEKADFSGGSNTPAPNVLMSTPEGLFFDPINNSMIFTDRGNCRVRSIDSKTGLENVIIGAGCGNADTEQEDPTDSYLRNPSGVVLHNNGVIFTDLNGGWGATRNSQIRVFNKNAVATNFFGTMVPAGKVSTIAGNFVLGSENIDNATWLSTYEGQLATNVSLGQPDSIATDGANLYITDYTRHCILKVDSAGILTTFAGSCGNSGYVNGTPYSDTTVRFTSPTQIITDPQVSGGFFVADQTNNNTSRIRYINTTGNSVTIADQTIAANTIATVFDSERGGGVAAFENWICYTSGHINRADLGVHNIICKDRTDAFGITQFRIGPSGSSDRGSVQFLKEEEGVVAPAAHFYGPWKIGFDNEGNLYISEYSAHVIRFVKRWW